MQLKRLEAYGFKSFADRIVVEFDRGITAVVGPNGSGKSNITDAVRWVLGEQNIRMLRGLRSEDIIFAGSTARRALSVAEVVLVFDNRDKTLPIDYEEVVVKRRLYRSGESEVYLNDARCRIKDIYRLFADTGIGHDGMSIIGQNRLNDILDSRPEERRVFFEETAGITKYRTRKQEALRKLRENDADLIRLSDIMYAQRAELEPLAAQAEKTSAYRELEAERRQYRLTSLVQTHEQLVGAQENLMRLLHNDRDEEASLIGERAQTEGKKRNIELEMEQIDSDLAEIEKSDTELQNALDALKKESAMLLGRQDQCVRRKEDLERLRESSRAKIEATEQEIVQIQNMLSGKIAAREEKEKAHTEAQEQLKNIRTHRALYEEQSARGSRSLRAVERVMVRLRESLAVAADHSERGDEGRLRRSEELSQKKCRIIEAQSELSRMEAALQDLEQQRDKCADDRVRLSHAVEEHRAKAQGIEEEMRRTAEEIQRAQQRYDFVRKLQESYEGFGKDVQMVLQAKEGWRSGVFGTVADLISIPERYLTAIEIALGGSVRNIITDDAQTAKAAIGCLKRWNGGRVTFLPLSSIVVQRPYDVDLCRVRGAVGWANTLVSAEERFQRAVDHLLSRTLVMETLDDALAAAKEHGYRIRMVTLTGELLNPGGAISGGGQRHRQSFLLNRRHEAETLAETLRTQKKRHIALQSDLEERNRLLHDDCTRRDAASAEEAELNRDLLAARSQRDIYRTRLADQTAAVEDLERKERVAQESSARAARKKELLERHLAQCGDHARRFSKETEEIAQKMTALSSEEQSCAQGLHALEVESAALDAEIRTGTDHVKTRTLECREATEMLDGFTEQIAKLSEELSAGEQRNAALESAISEEEGKLRAHRDNAQILKDRRLRYEADMRLLDDAIKRTTACTEQVRAKLHENDKQLDRINVRLADCSENLISEFGMTAETAAQQISPIDESVLNERLNELTNAINALGAVNPNAVEEYAEKKARYEEEEAQIHDLQKAKEDIERIIQKIDTDMTQTFREAFQQIQGYFNEIFMRLFGGGVAELRLTDQSDILSSGVEILVTLPHKKRQNLSALSGGERALTVIALLFSFLKYRPSTLSILYEIDAPIDEANVCRFGDFLQEFAHNTQFIIVTHRKGTMRAADSMYGVTVEDAGVSKVLSIRLKDYEESATA